MTRSRHIPGLSSRITGPLLIADGDALDYAVEDRVQHTDRLLRMAVNRVPEAVIIYDTNDRVVFVNQAYCDFFPYIPLSES